MQLLQLYAKGASQMQTTYMESQSTVKTSAGTMNQNLNINTRMWQKMPNKTCMIVQGAGSDMTIISDGQQMMTWFPAKKQYMIQPAPADPSAATGGAAGGMGAGMAQGMAFSPKAMENMANMVQSATLVGPDTVNGQPAKHLKLKMMGMDMDMWLSDSTTAPLPLRSTMTMNTPQMTMAYDSTMRWVLNEAIPDATFTVAAPAGATNMAGAAAVGPRATPANPAAQAEAVKSAMGQMMSQFPSKPSPTPRR